MAKLYLGCSGFSYKHWRGNFYPEDISQKEWFAHYRSVFATVELNVTFYRTPGPETFRHWYEESGENFSFAVKGSRYITHIKRLIDVESALDRFFGAAQELQEKLQVVLWQFPPQFKADLPRLEVFLDQVAQYHSRNTLEFRNQSWLTDEVVALCKSRNVSLCMADHPPFIDAPPVTADFVYIRRHGMEGSYNGFYSNEQLARDAARIRSYLDRQLNVYIYYNNDLGGAAPQNAQELASMLQEAT
ncbi:hypothetical protein GPEL0_01r1457 [Geoanaerobacter pelophilus]|uniref:DUF72 domain-containing protein n=1 Tax=Geoanaerobacter pelophilus TaxID=60036 RepID=A0ABQ0MJ65_9BACT|nr:DUF72 domain-containing protein [Geoanaerobacter pelophilus]GAW66196.1 hypothetical protein GPEL0_01r1457 [Geoanaerobacter pelophilus]